MCIQCAKNSQRQVETCQKVTLWSIGALRSKGDYPNRKSRSRSISPQHVASLKSFPMHTEGIYTLQPRTQVSLEAGVFHEQINFTATETEMYTPLSQLALILQRTCSAILDPVWRQWRKVISVYFVHSTFIQIVTQFCTGAFHSSFPKLWPLPKRFSSDVTTHRLIH